mgnify:CR=1 FL=1
MENFLENHEQDKNYYLIGNKTPLTYTLPSRHSKRYSLVWFDPKLGYEREMRYATNQKSIFVDEQKGECTMGHITFRDGFLKVPKNEQNLQKLLSIYHPLKNRIYEEYSAVEEAKDDLEKTIDVASVTTDMLEQLKMKFGK